MRIVGLERIAEHLEEPAHLVVWQCEGGFEVVALGGESFSDAFPLPMPIQAAAAAAGLILDTTTAARLEIERMPEDFWWELERVNYGEFLQVSMLGRAGAKYLHVFQAVRDAGKDRGARLTPGLDEKELLQVARWLRTEAVFDHRAGDALMEVLIRFAR